MNEMFVYSFFRPEILIPHNFWVSFPVRTSCRVSFFAGEVTAFLGTWQRIAHYATSK